MSNRDLYNKLKTIQAISPQKLAATGLSAAIPVNVGDSALLLVNVGGSTGTPTSSNRWDIAALESNSSTGTFTAVAAKDLVNGTVGSTIGAFGTVNSSAKLNTRYAASYTGQKKFIKSQIVKVASGPSIQAGSNVIIGDLFVAPNP